MSCGSGRGLALELGETPLDRGQALLEPVDSCARSSAARRPVPSASRACPPPFRRRRCWRVSRAPPRLRRRDVPRCSSVWMWPWPYRASCARPGVVPRLGRVKGIAVLVASLALVAASASEAKRQPVTVRVLTRNLYLGANLDSILQAKSFHEAFLAVEADWAQVQANDFPTRARAIAREIAQTRPDFVGFQELTLYRSRASARAACPRGRQSACGTTVHRERALPKLHCAMARRERADAPLTNTL